MHRRRFVQHLAVSSLGAGFAADHAAAAPALQPPLPQLSDGARQLAQRVLRATDPGQRPFAIVDKHDATIAVFRADGALVGVSRTLLGQARGDHSVPGVGERTQAGTLRAQDCTSPAGRFESQPGRNRQGEAVVWLDYASAFAIHRLRPGRTQPERARRLATGGAVDKRVSAGCVVVPETFYDRVVADVLGRTPGVVYVMPEEAAPHDSWRALWRQVSLRQMAAAAAAAAAANV